MLVGSVCIQGRCHPALTENDARTLVDSRGLEASGARQITPLLLRAAQGTASIMADGHANHLDDTFRLDRIRECWLHSRCGIRGQDPRANGLSHSARSRWNARMSYSTPCVKIILRRPTDKSRWCLPSGRRRANVWTQSASGTSWKCLWNGSGMCASGSQHPLCDEVGQASTQATCRVKRYRVPRSGVIDVADRVVHSQRRLVA